MNKISILIADDNDQIREAFSEILTSHNYNVLEAKDGLEAVHIIRTESPDVALLDLGMPQLNGLEVLKLLRAEINDSIRDYQHHLEKEVKSRVRELYLSHEKLKKASLETIYRLSRASEYKDEETSEHIQRMSKFSGAISCAMGLDNEISELILYSSPMHDIGKIGIPDSILLKPGKLDADEWEIMKTHTVLGSEILDNSDSDLIKMGSLMALTHHEKWDGSGYPKGLKKEKIPIEGRIVALADVFDALTSKRPYKEAFSNEKAFEIIKEGSGTHFDPAVVTAFFNIQHEIVKIQNDSRKSKAQN